MNKRVVCLATGMQVFGACLQREAAYMCGFVNGRSAALASVAIMSRMGELSGMEIENVYLRGVNYPPEAQNCYRDPDDWMEFHVRINDNVYIIDAFPTVYGCMVAAYVDPFDEWNDEREAVEVKLGLFLNETFMVWTNGDKAGARTAFHANREWMRTTVAEVLDSADYPITGPLGEAM